MTIQRKNEVHVISQITYGKSASDEALGVFKASDNNLIEGVVQPILRGSCLQRYHRIRAGLHPEAHVGSSK